VTTLFFFRIFCSPWALPFSAGRGANLGPRLKFLFLGFSGKDPARCAFNFVCLGTRYEPDRFEPSEVFTSKEEAEAYGLELAKAWVDEQS
jgi:hypothetical protein